jgi:hypothetical protein
VRTHAARTSTSSAPDGRTAEAKEDRLTDCPVCGEANHLVLTRKLDRGGEPSWFLYCHTASCQALEGAYLAALAGAVGAPHGGWLKEDPLRWLAVGAAGKAGFRRPRSDAPWVSYAQVRRWHERLIESPDVLDYLRVERGLSSETIASHLLGYDGRAIGAPVFESVERCLVANVKRRYWPEPWKLDAGGKAIWKRGLAGAPARLYPDLPRRRPWLLCEGEFDALLARQRGFPAVTSTTGTSWSSDWDWLVRGRRVAVIYDAGQASVKIAERRAEQLRGAGANAWAVALPLADGEDLTDWFIRHRRTAGELRQLIRRARRVQCSGQ